MDARREDQRYLRGHPANQPDDYRATHPRLQQQGPQLSALPQSGGTTAAAASSTPRLRWLDGIKGLAILWIAYFHCFEAYINRRLPSPLGPHYFASFIHQYNPRSTGELAICLIQATYAAIAGVGFHAVGVFIVMSGFGLTFSLTRSGGPRGGWTGWYRSRLVRLFPMYWAAHLLYLISPFEARSEPIDYRFVLSFLGDRVYPIYTIFYYANPAWWYFGLILELYIVFPLLYLAMRRLGPSWFLVLCAIETIVSRYLVIFVLETSGYYLLGAFFGCRLWEFGLGMVFGVAYHESNERFNLRLFSGGALVAAIATYTGGLYSYDYGLAYTLTDGLIGTGLFVILAQIAWHLRRVPRLDAAAAFVGVWSYGFYLIHQPYVIYFGARMRWLPMGVFALAVIPLIALLAWGSSRLERVVNNVTNRLLDPRTSAPARRQASAGA
jgi:peptidoglycan/LPS O-acetylase OafA/YrhL